MHVNDNLKRFLRDHFNHASKNRPQKPDQQTSIKPLKALIGTSLSLLIVSGSLVGCKKDSGVIDYTGPIFCIYQDENGNIYDAHCPE